MRSPEPSVARRLPIEGGVLLLVAVLCLWFQGRLPTVLPAQGDYEQVQQVLEAEAQPGDALLLFPWWTERARIFSPDRVTVVGYQGSDGDDLERHPRVWVLSQPDLPKASESSFAAAFAPQRTAIGQERVFGHLHLSLYQNGRHRPATWSLNDALPSAQVYVEGPDGSRLPCSWDGKAHRCGGGNYVAVEWHEAWFQPRRCVRLYPPGGPAKLVVELQNVPAAAALELYGTYVWDRGWFHEDKFTPIFLQAEVNGAQAAAIDFPHGKLGLQKVMGPPVPAGSTVRFSSQSQNTELRELCVEAYGLAP